MRVYGVLGDNGSYAQVTRGFVEGIRAHGYTDETLDVKSMEEEPAFDEEPTGLPLAKSAVVTGPPSGAPCLLRGVRHEKRFVMVAPNSTKLPERTMAIVNSSATHLLVPSAWAAGVVAKYTHLPILVAPHGVSQEFFVPESTRQKLVKDYDEGNFRILHLSSTGGGRKGTIELFRAFVRAKKNGYLPRDSKLLLVLTPQAKGALLDELSTGATGSGVMIVDRLFGIGATPRQMSEFLNGAHVVCQPSRGEAFGMIPLEALASGVPVVATSATGHSEWLKPELEDSVIVVPTHELRPMEDDMPGAQAPHLYFMDVADALSKAYLEWRERRVCAIARAAEIRERFSWKKQLAEFVSFAKGEVTDATG